MRTVLLCIYTASTYGAYRTTSDVTCAFIEGQSDNAFLTPDPFE